MVLRSSTTEPTPALKAVFDMPLQVELSPELAGDIEALASATRGVEPDDPSWADTYEAAIGLVERALTEVDTRMEQLQTELLSLDDPNRIRQDQSGAPQREADRARAELKAGLSELVKEWTERSKRQREQTATASNRQAADSLSLEEAQVTAGTEFRVDTNWWAQFRGHTTRIADQWSDKFSHDSETALQALIHQISSRYADRIPDPSRRTPPPPPATNVPMGEWRESAEPPIKRADVPTIGSALGSYLRSNIMAVGMLSTVVMGAAFAAGSLLGKGGSGGMSGGSLMLRGGMMIAVLPLLGFLGYGAAKGKREKMRAQAIDSARDSLRKFVASEIDNNLGKHQQQLERWLQARVKAHDEAFGAWFDAEVLPTYTADGADLTARVTALKLQHGKLNDRLGAMKLQRNRMRQNLLFDLKKRLRDLQTASAD